MMDAAERLLLLGQRLAAEQDRALSHDLSLGGVRARVVSRPAQRPKSRRALSSGLALAAAAVVALTAYALTRRPAPIQAHYGPRALAVGEWVSSAAVGEPPIHFSDGSEVSLSPGARARLATLDAQGAHLVLESGSADVHVVPGHGAHYRVSSGPFAVEVTGTRFDVGFQPSSELFTLALHEGKVIVSGCVLGEGRALLAGEMLRASCRSGKFEISAIGAAASREPVPAASGPSSAETSTDGAAAEAHAAARELVTSPPSWQHLAAQGRFAEAYALVGGSFEAVMARASLKDLALLGDTARLAGKPNEALSAYQTLRSRAPASALAKQSAFAIARVHFDQRAAYAEAARWFRTYLAEQPGGAFAREAEGRLIEASSRAGDVGGARAAAENYLDRYPHGPHERVARQLLGR